MAVETFAAIDVGSFELGMKIFEFSKKGSIREIDHIRQRVDIGSDTYADGKISYKNMEELCRVLREFTRIMKSYHVEKYRAYGTSAIRETDNTPIVVDQIRQRTGLEIGVLSNSEQRFLDYKAVALKTKDFEKIIEEGALILDIGGGSIQLSLFENGKLLTTQNMRMGVLRIAEEMMEMEPKISRIRELLSEMTEHHLETFRELFLGSKKVRNLIVIDDYVSQIIQKRAAYANGGESGHNTSRLEIAQFNKFINELHSKSREELSGMLGIPEENAKLMYISAALVSEVAQMCKSDKIMAPGVTLCDGIAYEYAQTHKLIPDTHDFVGDIVSCAQHIALRYNGREDHIKVLEKLSLEIFDSMKKMHGLGARERLLLRIAVRLHDIGKYVSMSLLGESAYRIVMATEIIGLSHSEREIVARIIKYNYDDYEYQDDKHGHNMNEHIDESELVIAKLTAILRLGNALDRSHKQKIRNISVSHKDDLLIIGVDCEGDITLERNRVDRCGSFFGEIFAVRPVIVKKSSVKK